MLEQVVLCDCSGLKDELDFMLKLIRKADYEGQYRRQTIVLLCIRGLLAEGNFEVKVTINYLSLIILCYFIVCCNTLGWID